MQRKARCVCRAKLIAHHKTINNYCKGVKYWTDVDKDYRENDDENPEPQ
jgi:hypothetical protein